MADDLIAAHRDNPKLMPYLHLPVQSGSDAVLEAMNRQHKADDYRRLVERIRGARPDIALSSDFIVGFPGESDADFEATLQLVRDVGYATAFSFKYSKRPGTPASTLRKQIPEDVKAARLEALQKLLLAQQDAFNDSQIGKTLPVLFEKPGREPGQLMGRSPICSRCMSKPMPRASARLADVSITQSHRQQPARGSGLSAKKNALTLEFPDNALAAALAGAHARHFARIEQKLDVGHRHARQSGGHRPARSASAPPPSCARSMPGWKPAKASPWPKSMPRSASPMPAGVNAPGAIKTASSRAVRPRSPAQAAYLDLMRHHPLVFGIGPAGTGKTYLAAAFAAHMLHERRVERLILSRPALEAGERLGFLPGDLKEKIDPYLRPLYDALFDVLGEAAGRLMEQGMIEVAPLAFMRGRTLTRAFVILDEAQNTTPAQMKMALTRLGEDSHMVVTGDPSQSDLPGGVALGLNEALAILEGVEGVGVARSPKRTWCAIPSSRASSPPIIARRNSNIGES